MTAWVNRASPGLRIRSGSHPATLNAARQVIESNGLLAVARAAGHAHSSRSRSC
ncbi:MAG: hypothetical protein ACRDVZ_17195 [Jiangellaceae bacterium]